VTRPQSVNIYIVCRSSIISEWY